ncbi:MAG TPA: hypothetical protein VGL05_19670 [Kribbella sp.]
MNEPQTSQRRHVQVWFGSHVIADYTAEPELADRYAAAMGRRFAGLKVTNDPVPLPTSQPLPNERLWGLPPH